MKRLQAIAAMMLIAVTVFGGLACDGGKTGENDTSATITWLINRPASGQVKYGTSTEYGSLSTMNNESVRNHSVVINGLSQETTYHFRVKSTDADGKEATSEDQTFKTLVSSVDKPNVQFLSTEQCESYTYSPFGSCTSATIGVPLENTGGAGDVFVVLGYKGSDSVKARNVFHFDEGESAMVYASVDCPTVTTTYEWTARVASSSDTSLGNMWLERKDGSTDNGQPHSAIKDGCLYGVWGISPSDVFAVGYSGIILHYDGGSWNYMTSRISNQLNDVWGSSSSDVFAVGASGTILHYNGSTWSAMTTDTSNTLWDVWGSSGSNVFAVGSFGLILHYNGSAWSAMSSGTHQDLMAVWGSSGSDVFAIGYDSTILHYDGVTWSAMSSGTTDDYLRDIWGSSASDVFAVGYRNTPSAVNQSRPFRALILHYDGTAWSEVMASNDDTANDFLDAVWGSSPYDVYAVGTTRAHYDGSAWSMMTGGGWAVWGSSATDVFAVRCGGLILHYDGNTWSEIMIP